MPAKPVIVFCAFGLVLSLAAGGLKPANAVKPPPPTVLLYAASASDVSALIDLRTRLRLDGQLDVLTYDPDSAAVKRVAMETSHPEWLVAPSLNDDSRLALARALGVAFYAVLSPGRAGDSTHIELVETAPSERIFDWEGVNRQYAAHAIESQAVLDLPTLPVPASPAPSPVLTSPAPLPVLASPVPNFTITEKITSAPPMLMAEAIPLSPAPAVPLHSFVPAPIITVPSAVKIIVPPAAPVRVAQVPQIALPTLPVPLPTAQEPVTPPVPAAAPITDVLPAPIPSSPAPITTDTGKETEAKASEYYSIPQSKPEDLAAISPLLRKGDSALEGGDVVGAISIYRQAVNGAPLSVVPRLRLAKAYQHAGMAEKSLSEAKRALELAPDNIAIQEFLTVLDTDNGTSDGAIARYRTALERDPQNAAAHSSLADALWNSGDLASAEYEYKAAKQFAPEGDHSADSHLAQLYATEARYDDCLAALETAGKDGYTLALHIVKNRADTLSSTVESSRDAFAAGKSTREQFYDGAKKASAQAQALAGFVAKITPPVEFKLSHLHRILSTNLLAQEGATLVTFIETGEAALGDRVSQLDKESQTEMLTAHTLEEKLGLWEARK